MSCEHPVTLFRRPGFNKSTGRFFPPVSEAWIRSNGLELSAFEQVLTPCGKCFSCLKDKARDITVRAFHEAKMHKHSSFVTLTVDDDHLRDVFPLAKYCSCGKHFSLSHKPFQDFFKRLRKNSGLELRYLMCAEYGEHTCRPHYHCIIFGLSPDARKSLMIERTDPLLGTARTLYSGFLRSELIERAWPFGNVYIGTATPNSIAYCAGYTMKSLTLGRDDKWYRSRGLAKEYQKWSRRPGLGSLWLEDNLQDLYRCNDLFNPLLADNSCIMSGSVVCLPRYYRNRIQSLAEKDVDLFSDDRDLVLLCRRKNDIIMSSQRELMRLASGDDGSYNIAVESAKLEALRNRLELQKFKVAERKRL